MRRSTSFYEDTETLRYEKDINHKYNLNMENALDKALANASLNARMNGDTLHTENLDSIADPTLDEPQSIAHHTLLAADEIMFGWNKLHSPKKRILEEPHLYQQKMEEEYKNKVDASSATASSIHHLSVLVQAVDSKVNHIIDVIQEAKQSMPQEPDHKHRSLHEWDDQYLINELVERENDLMPFYYELLKRIGSPELQKLVMSSMQGKNASMVTLAQLCSALAPQPPQSQYPHISEAQRAELKARSDLDRIAHEQSQYVPTTIPQQQYFGQATEEYIRQINSR